MISFEVIQHLESLLSPYNKKTYDTSNTTDARVPNMFSLPLFVMGSSVGYLYLKLIVQVKIRQQKGIQLYIAA